MKRKRVFAAFLSLVLAGQMAFSAIPAYAAGADDSITDAGTAKSDAVDPEMAMNFGCGTHPPAARLTGKTHPL